MKLTRPVRSRTREFRFLSGRIKCLVNCWIIFLWRVVFLMYSNESINKASFLAAIPLWGQVNTLKISIIWINSLEHRTLATLEIVLDQTDKHLFLLQYLQVFHNSRSDHLSTFFKF
jgi:hypothetical protein